MNYRHKLSAILLMLMLFVAASSMAQAQSGSTIGQIVSTDARLAEFSSAVNQAQLNDMFNGAGPYTIFAPTDAAYAAIGGASANSSRQSVLYHTLQGSYDMNALAGQAVLNTALGKELFVGGNGYRLNDSATVIVTNITASNGTIHIIDAVLNHNLEQFGATGDGAANSGGQWSEQAPAEEVNPLVAPEAHHASISEPTQNPAFVSGGLLPYWSGIHADSSTCKGVTWTLHKQYNGAALVGSDRKTNPYRGDISCDAYLPMLCLHQDYSYPPAGVNTNDSWAFGQIKVTTPLQGHALTSRAEADALCAQAYGINWRMAEFHDGSLAASIGMYSGHNFWAAGSVPSNQRFWVAISDQAANPWNSVNPKTAPPRIFGHNVFLAGADSAFIGLGPMRMTEAEGRAEGRWGCQGMTWVLHKQINGKVQLGADHSSNPYVGDRPCNYAYPVLCIQVQGFAPPPNSHGEQYNIGWSGGVVKASRAVPGTMLNTRAAANQVCQDTFGQSWRIAEFHDGNMGTEGGGWEFWAYGAMPGGLRYWVAINDQLANPWNP